MFKGLSLEAALAKVLKAALNAMSIDNFGALFVGLPPEKQAELEALAKKKIESGDIFKDSGQLQSLSDTIVSSRQQAPQPANNRSTPWKAEIREQDPSPSPVPQELQFRKHRIWI